MFITTLLYVLLIDSGRKENKMSRVIGIDLGTTNSCVSVIENGEAIMIPSMAGGMTTPSIVAFTKEGERYIGEKAKRQAVTNPERTISSVKRHMGSDWKIVIDGKEYNPQIISAMILMQLKKDAEEYLGETISEAVITVPAYFNDIQRQATKDAGAIAGLEVKRIINEPTSAAVSYGLDHGEPQKVLVYDLGGGTFDVSIIEIGEGVIEVLATAGDNHLGGDDFDQKLADWIAEQIRQQSGIKIDKDLMAKKRVLEVAEQTKKTLSTAQQAVISLPYIAQTKGGAVNFETTITRAQFDALTKDIVERTVHPVQTALNDAGISPLELNKVLLVGGSTRIPAVQEQVRKLTGKEPSQNINPDECVAKGAAILGETLQGTMLPQTMGNGLLLLDVTPLSLSIETVGGVATRLVEKNTTLPTKYSKIFSTAMPYQRNVDIHVLQGERPMAKDNKTIGKFRLKGIKKAPAGVPQIEVTFDIDTNGILKVSAKDLDTGKQQSIVITANDRMSDSEIEQAKRNAQEYAGIDKLRVETMELLQESNQLLDKTGNAMKAAGKQLDKTRKKEIKADRASLQKYIGKCKLDKLKEADVENLRMAKQRLEVSAQSIAQWM